MQTESSCRCEVVPVLDPTVEAGTAEIKYCRKHGTVDHLLIVVEAIADFLEGEEPHDNPGYGELARGLRSVVELAKG